MTYAKYLELLKIEKTLTAQVNAEFDPFNMIEHEPSEAEKQLSLISNLINYYSMVNQIEVYDDSHTKIIDRVKSIDDAKRKYGENVFCLVDEITTEWTMRRYSE